MTTSILVVAYFWPRNAPLFEDVAAGHPYLHIPSILGHMVLSCHQKVCHDSTCGTIITSGLHPRYTEDARGLVVAECKNSEETP